MNKPRNMSRSRALTRLLFRAGLAPTAAAVLSLSLLLGCEEGSKDPGLDEETDAASAPGADDDAGSGKPGADEDAGSFEPDAGAVEQPDARFAELAEVAEATMRQSFAKGISVAVMEGGKLVWAQGFGSASPVEVRPITPDTTFQIGSTTKQLTAMAVLDQVADGLYSLDDTVAELLPKFLLRSDPEWAKTATLRDLLSHRSGLVDEITAGLTSADEGLSSRLYGEFAETKWAMNPPGLFWNYSNPNFGLAGLILEEHDPEGRAYADIVEEELFAPLGMTRSYGRIADAKSAGTYAESFGSAKENFHVGIFPDISFGEPRAQTIDELPDDAYNRPAGGSTFSTPSDMCRWGHFVMHGNEAILPENVRAELIAKPLATGLNESARYGLGQFVWTEFALTGDPLFSTEFYPIEVWEHGGNTLSFTSSLLMVPSRDLVVSILSNGEGTNHGPLQAAILKAALDPLPEPIVRAPAVDKTKFAAFAGTYVDPHVAGEITIVEGGTTGLTISIPAFVKRGYPVKAELTPVSTYLWLATVGDLPLDISFVRDDDGKLTPWLRSRLFVAERTDAAPVASE